jgi:RES domain-containing protein
MRLWRISSWRGLEGIGGYHKDGRWHTRGRPVIYAAEHPALATLEALAHLRPSSANIPLSLKLIAIDIGEHAPHSEQPDLPPGWQANETSTQAVGDAWLASCGALALPVPSAVVAHSTNYVINPAHPQAAIHLSEGPVEAFWFDQRHLA